MVKNLPASTEDARDVDLIPGSERSVGNGTLLQYPFLGNHMVRGAWWATVHSKQNTLLVCNKKEGTINTCNKMDETQKHITNETPQPQKTKYVMIPFIKRF